MKTPPNQTAFESATDDANHTSRNFPELYLAGKISKNDWRHELVPGLSSHDWASGPITTGSFSYVGPFFVSCDHGCSHGANTHGVMGKGCTEPNLGQREVYARNKAAVAEADLVFAYIAATDCHGTLVEIGMALSLGKRVVIALAPAMPVADFWFSTCAADAVYPNVRPCCLTELIENEIEKTAEAMKQSGLHRG